MPDPLMTHLLELGGNWEVLQCLCVADTLGTMLPLLLPTCRTQGDTATSGDRQHWIKTYLPARPDPASVLTEVISNTGSAYSVTKAALHKSYLGPHPGLTLGAAFRNPPSCSWQPKRGGSVQKMRKLTSGDVREGGKTGGKYQSV